MRRLILGAAVWLLGSTALVAQQQGDLRIHVFATDVAYSSSAFSGRHLEGGYGVALNYWWLPRISGYLSIGSELHHSNRPTTLGDGMPGFRSFGVRSYPIDALAQYHFKTDSRWKPYAGLGLRYTPAPHPSFGVFSSRLNGEADGGVLFSVTPRFALDIGATRLFERHSPSYDPLFKPTIGVSWRF
jgi:outer membrane protein W